MGYRETHLCISEATYLRNQLKGGKKSLTQTRIAAILQIPNPKTERQAQEYIIVVGYCCLSKPGFGNDISTMGGRGTKPLIWTETEKKIFEVLKTALTLAPALAFPYVSKPFHLFVYETKNIAKGIFHQNFGATEMPWAYLGR